MFPDEDSYPSCDHTPLNLPGNKIAIPPIPTDFGRQIVSGPQPGSACRMDARALPGAEWAGQKAGNWQNLHHSLE